MENEIKAILAELLKNDEILDIGKDVDLIGYGLDSLEAIELVVLLEEKYSISFDEEDLLIEKMSTVELIMGTINKYLNA